MPLALSPQLAQLQNQMSYICLEETKIIQKLWLQWSLGDVIFSFLTSAIQEVIVERGFKWRLSKLTKISARNPQGMFLEENGIVVATGEWS